MPKRKSQNDDFAKTESEPAHDLDTVEGLPPPTTKSTNHTQKKRPRLRSPDETHTAKDPGAKVPSTYTLAISRRIGRVKTNLLHSALVRGPNRSSNLSSRSSRTMANTAGRRLRKSLMRKWDGIKYDQGSVLLAFFNGTIGYDLVLSFNCVVKEMVWEGAC